jgi:hypothetical protein
LFNDLERRTKVLFASLSDEATARARKQFKINTAVPMILHACGKKVGIVGKQLVLGLNPRAAISNGETIHF